MYVVKVLQLSTLKDLASHQVYNYCLRLGEVPSPQKATIHVNPPSRDSGAELPIFLTTHKVQCTLACAAMANDCHQSDFQRQTRRELWKKLATLPRYHLGLESTTGHLRPLLSCEAPVRRVTSCLLSLQLQKSSQAHLSSAPGQTDACSQQDSVLAGVHPSSQRGTVSSPCCLRPLLI